MQKGRAHARTHAPPEPAAAAAASASSDAPSRLARRGDASASPGAMSRAHKAEARAREAVALLLRCPVRSILTAVLRFAYK